ncbi:MAG: triose-phosphate isomerase [Dethiosulfovibrio peptidovorans]|nr:MAG: triose-phosphate isomerase [Dethiosulfovibrio peptidovorans]
MKRYLFGNWKMNMSGADTDHFFDNLPSASRSDVTMAVFPPSIYLERAFRAVERSGSPVALGVQNVHSAHHGSYTGEISISMALDCGATYALVGHSERRHIFGESDEATAQKLEACSCEGLRPVLCVGETLKEREAGKTWVVVERQLNTGLAGSVNPDLLLVAYEPVWAIGTGCTASPGDAQEVCGAIRRWLRGRFPGKGIPILYGGSVKPDNASGLFAMADIDGGLVGGASMNPSSFAAMAQAR